MKKSKFETDSTDFVIGRINRNRIASGSVRQKMRRFDGDPEKGISGLIKKLSDPSDNGFITSNLRKEYQSRELDLCGFLDRSRWTDNQIHIMRRIVGEMKTIFELAGMQGIQIDPIFVGLHRLDSELKNCTKRDPKKRATAQNNLRIELFRIRKRSMKIERDNEIPSFKEYLTTGIWH